MRHPRHRQAMPPGRWLLALAALAALCGLWLACSSEPEPQPADGWWLVADARALDADLERLQHFSGAPAAAWASTMRQRLVGCRRAAARASRLDELSDALGCADGQTAEPPLPTLDEPGVAWIAGGRFETVEWLAEARLEGDQTVVDIELSGRPEGRLASLLPRAEPVGQARFGGPLLMHGRFGADGGLDLASWVADGAAEDRLFGLRHRLFSKALLTGVWEVAVPAPAEGETLLPLVLALETRGRAATRAAVEAWATDLERSWGLRPTTTEIAGQPGACFDELRVMPAFRPCWLQLDDALVVGWNATALARSLDLDRSADHEDQPSRLVIHLDRFPAADAILAQAAHAPADSVPGPYPWRRWSIEGYRDGDSYRIRAWLQPADLLPTSTAAETGNAQP